MNGAGDSTRAALLVFVLLFGTYAYFTHPADPALFNSNELVRFLLTKSVVLDRSVSIERYSTSGVDMARYGGLYFSGKAPGLSAAAAPFYWLACRSRAGPLRDGAALYAVRLAAVSLPAALFPIALLGFVRRLGTPERFSRLLTVGYGLGTMAFAYAVVFMAHQPAAILAFLSLLALLRWRRGRCESAGLALASGVLGGLAVAFEYPTALLILLIAAFAFLPCRRPAHILCFLGGLVPGAILVLGYNFACFGDPLSFPYAHEAMPAAQKVQSTGLFGVALPSPYAFLMLLASPFRGLFFVSPFLILAIPGFASLWKMRHQARFEERVGMSPARLLFLSLSATVCYILFNSSYRAWSGGAAYGPRHLVPVLPFFLIPIAALLRARPREYRWPAVLLISYSIFFTLIAVAGGPEAHEYLRNPVRESALLHVATGNIRWNWGYALGLRELLSLLPPGLLWWLCLTVLFRGTHGPSPESFRPFSRGERLLRALTLIFGSAMAALFLGHRTPESAYRWAVLGHGFDMRGDEARAAAYFENSLALDPRNPLVLRDYARLAARRGDYSRALDLQMRLLAIRPADREVQRGVEILVRLKKLEDKRKKKTARFRPPLK